MLILDACVGAEKIYQGMNKLLKENFISIDIRKGDFSYEPKYNRIAKTTVIVKPLILADMKHLPFKDKIFDVIICDPPHMQLSEKSMMYAEYGSWTKNDKIVSFYKTNEEFKRCLKPNGILIVKIMPEDKDRVISLFNNFIFFLPIQTIRPHGCITPKETKLGAVWLIGILKDR